MNFEGGRQMEGLELGSYRIEAQLGEGGMGVVYRALDTRFNRAVAVKFLSGDVADSAARRRFQREAQMASSLNHPHILTVYDAGEFEGRQFLVTEFVDGGTLKDWAGAEKRSWQDVVDLLLGVADGLSAAHQAGILHRDIKPDNILVAKNGYAKLADFGLAKLAEADLDAAATLSDARTRPGVILGSIPYMSPEQASGKPLDARSDIFSFGIVLFEVLAGRRPFVGAAGLELLHAIVHTPTPLLSELNPSVPAGLQAAVEKALEKDPTNRYQTMREFVVDLRRVARQSGNVPAPQRPGRKRVFTWAALIVLVVLAAASAVVLLRTPRPAGPKTQQYVQLTNFADSAHSPALSPDGRMLAFLRGGSPFADNPSEVYVKLLPGGEAVALTRDKISKQNPKFSPDGSRIAYTQADPTGARLDTWIVPVLGGRPQPFLTNASGLTWIKGWNAGAAGTPMVLFSEFTGRGFQMSLVSSTESRSDVRTVYLPAAETGMAHRSYISPDGKQVLAIEMGNHEGRGGYSWLPCRLMPLDGSSTGKPVGPAPAQCTDAAWSPDGKWMYFSTNTGNGYHIWRQRYPDGKPEQVTFGVTEEEGIYFDPDGRSFVTAIGNRQSTVWIHDSRGDRQITSEGFAYYPTVSPDGKKVYYLVRAGGSQNFVTGGLWVADLESDERRRLLPDFQMQQFSISADGQRIVFVAVEDNGDTPVMLAPLDGRTAPRRLSMMDAIWVYFGGKGEVVFQSDLMYRIKEDGSDLRSISPTRSLNPFSVSPDGQWVPAAEGPVPEDRNVLKVYPVGGGSPRLICRCYPPPNLDDGPGPAQLSWAPDGRFLYLKFDTTMYAIPLKPGEMLPSIPPSGFPSKEAVAAVPGARLISEDRVFPGPNPSLYAFMKVSAQRNIYRVPVP